MTTTKRQRKMSYRSSVTVNFVCATKFCFDPPFFNGSCPRALSAQYSAHHTSRKSQLARFPAHPFWRPDRTVKTSQPYQAEMAKGIWVPVTSSGLRNSDLELMSFCSQVRPRSHGKFSNYILLFFVPDSSCTLDSWFS